MKNIIVISGPSGCGKSTLIKRLLKQHPEIIFSASYTTRDIRDNEIDGKDYYFISRKRFLKMVDNNEFVEWAQVYQNYYGSTYQEIESKSKGGRILLLDIDTQGAKNIKKKFPDALFICVVPPSLEKLKQRLVGREQKIDQNIKHRLEIAKEELKQYNLYDYVIINDNLEEAYTVLDAIYTAFQNTTARHEAFIKNLFISKK